MSLQVVFETHANTTDNEAGIATGWLPGELSERGRRTAGALGIRRRENGIVAIFVSDLARAVETARIAFDGTTLPVFVDARLRECNYGKLNGMPTARLERERTDHVDVPWPGGESYRDVVDRTRELLGELTPSWDGARVLVISHSANKWALDHLLLGRDLYDVVAAGLAWQEGWEYVVPTGWVGRSLRSARPAASPPPLET